MTFARSAFTDFALGYIAEASGAGRKEKTPFPVAVSAIRIPGRQPASPPAGSGA
jgi:hypothetical protein